MAYLSQARAFSKKREPVHRASAVFHHRPGTTYSILDYWRLKRGIQVELRATLRTMDGRTLGTETLHFRKSPVLNYRPSMPEAGSVEFEAFSESDLVIPYAAVLAMVETEDSLSLLHSYSRLYQEGESGIGEGEESGWTLRDGPEIRSFAVLHNGSRPAKAQTMTLRLVNAWGETRTIEATQGEVPPFATIRLVAQDFFPELPAFLRGKPGHASISFRLERAFPRMLVGNETIDGRELSCTHSNFDYTRHRTDTIAEGPVLFRLPRLGGSRRDVVVYPTTAPGSYRASLGEDRREFASGELLLWENATQSIRFTRHDGPFPSRLVAALVLPTRGRLPVEMSSGVLHPGFERKHMWWATAHARGKLVVTVAEDVLGSLPDPFVLSVRLYSSRHAEPLERALGKESLQALEDGMPTPALFPEAQAFLGGEYGYWVLTSDYSGLFVFTWLESARGSFGYEHSF